MTTNSSEIITELLEKREKRQQVIEETLKLIEKAAEKYRYDRESRRRWNRILMRLEDSLLEVKKAVAECDTLIDIEQGKVRKTPEKPEQDRALAQPEAESPRPPEDDPERRAAYEIAETPREELANISLQDAALARAYIERQGFLMHDEAFRKTLSAKLELVTQLPRSHDAMPEQGERRNQVILRGAITKMQLGQIRNMDDNELDLLVSCYTILRDKLLPTASNKRLLKAISGTIRPLRAERARRHLFSC